MHPSIQPLTAPCTWLSSLGTVCFVVDFSLSFFFCVVFDNLGNLGSVSAFCNVGLQLIQARPDSDHRYASVNLNGVAYVLVWPDLNGVTSG